MPRATLADKGNRAGVHDGKTREAIFYPQRENETAPNAACEGGEAQSSSSNAGCRMRSAEGAAKSQTPKPKFQTNPKLQIPNKSQAPKEKMRSS